MQLRTDPEAAREPRGLRELIPIYLRAGILRRVEDFEGGIQFIEVRTDRIFARVDPRGRLACAGDEG